MRTPCVEGMKTSLHSKGNSMTVFQNQATVESRLRQRPREWRDDVTSTLSSFEGVGILEQRFSKEKPFKKKRRGVRKFQTFETWEGLKLEDEFFQEEVMMQGCSSSTLWLSRRFFGLT
ncbi:hypothetical protein Tco_1142772 [Tanacetum coccineum]